MSHCSGGHCGHLTKFIPDQGRGGGDGPGMSQLYGGIESGMTSPRALGNLMRAICSDRHVDVFVSACRQDPGFVRQVVESHISAKS